jgi:hypothetical protein
MDLNVLSTLSTHRQSALQGYCFLVCWTGVVQHCVLIRVLLGPSKTVWIFSNLNFVAIFILGCLTFEVYGFYYTMLY